MHEGGPGCVRYIYGTILAGSAAGCTALLALFSQLQLLQPRFLVSYMTLAIGLTSEPLRSKFSVRVAVLHVTLSMGERG